jgi:hypothetical protein
MPYVVLNIRKHAGNIRKAGGQGPFHARGNAENSCAAISLLGNIECQ